MPGFASHCEGANVAGKLTLLGFGFISLSGSSRLWRPCTGSRTLRLIGLISSDRRGWSRATVARAAAEVRLTRRLHPGRENTKIALQ